MFIMHCICLTLTQCRLTMLYFHNWINRNLDNPDLLHSKTHWRIQGGWGGGFGVASPLWSENFTEKRYFLPFLGLKQNRKSTEGCSNSIVRKNNKFGKCYWFLQVEHMQVPNGTGPGARRSKRPLSACHTRRKCSMETYHNSVKGRVR